MLGLIKFLRPGYKVPTYIADTSSNCRINCFAVVWCYKKRIYLICIGKSFIRIEGNFKFGYINFKDIRIVKYL